MPITWILRKILLESILLPFVLLSRLGSLGRIQQQLKQWKVQDFLVMVGHAYVNTITKTLSLKIIFGNVVMEISQNK